MYICLCHSLTEKVIRQTVRRHNPTSLQQLRCFMPIGTQCGKCVRQTREILQEEHVYRLKVRDVA